MGVALFMLLEKLVLSPVAQQAAWDMIGPYLQTGQAVPPKMIELANEIADRTHASIVVPY